MNFYVIDWKLIWEWCSTVNEDGKKNNFSLIWVSDHSEIEGYEETNILARKGSRTPITGIEWLFSTQEGVYQEAESWKKHSAGIILEWITWKRSFRNLKTLGPNNIWITERINYPLWPDSSQDIVDKWRFWPQIYTECFAIASLKMQCFGLDYSISLYLFQWNFTLVAVNQYKGCPRMTDNAGPYNLKMKLIESIEKGIRKMFLNFEL